MSQSDGSQRLLTVAQVATALGLSKTTVYAWARQGDIEIVRYGPERKPGQRGRGGAIRIPERALERFKPSSK